MPAELVFRLLSSRQEGEESDLIRLIHAASDDDDENDALLLISLSLYQKKKKKRKNVHAWNSIFRHTQRMIEKSLFCQFYFFFVSEHVYEDV